MNDERFQGRAAVSVVVIGRNEGERLGRCLWSVKEAARHAHGNAALDVVEVIYVDSGSVDHSVALAEQLGARVIALHPERPTAALGRNAGWRAAGGEFVLFLDGDTELASGFLPIAVDSLRGPAVGVVWGHRRELHPEASVYNRVLDLDWIYPPGPAEFCGGDALFRRRLLEETGGFDETLIAGEEPELCRRILAHGGSILHIDAPMTGHDLQISRWEQYWRRASRAGHAYAEVSARFADTSGQFWRADAVRNRRRALLLLLLPLLAIVAVVWTRSILPFVLWLALMASLTLRTAWKARWKSSDWRTLLLYGMHSHLQQVPIFWGQTGYWLSRWRGSRRSLVEYKRP